MIFCSLHFFQNHLYRNILSGIPSDCQTVWVQIRPDNLSGLIWVQTVCKGFQRTTLVDKYICVVKVGIALGKVNYELIKFQARSSYSKCDYLLTKYMYK